MDNTDIKGRYGIVGNDPMLNQAIETAVQVAPIQLSVLIIGESGSGKEAFPRIIHENSSRKHNPYVAVNCGAIPEGTIDSELFGHEKGSFTGALSERKGYFEEANGGTIFLDEIGELPLTTQAKLLRVLESGEYLRVGSSVVKKTDVRIVAATNVDLEKAIGERRFREDLFYRLNGILIRIPPLRNRKNDIPALFRKFTVDFAEKNHMPSVRLTDAAVAALKRYDWPGNVRQLKNFAEQVTVLAPERTVDEADIAPFIPDLAYRGDASPTTTLPQIDGAHKEAFNSDRELLYKILFDMRNDVNDLKKLVMELINNGGNIREEDVQIIKRLYPTHAAGIEAAPPPTDDDYVSTISSADFRHQVQDAQPYENKAVEVDNLSEPAPLSLEDHEKELIRKALERNNGNRRKAAQELKISERTLYRKIDAYDIKL